MKCALIAMALLLGALFPARAHILPLVADDGWTEALNLRGAACFHKPNTFVDPRLDEHCRRGHVAHRTARARPAGRFACNADVLRSEELAGAPIFYHHVRAALRVTPPGKPAFETTIEGLTPWQVPPPRKGGKLRLWCDPASPSFVTLN